MVCPISRHSGTGVSCTKLLEPDGGRQYLKSFPRLDSVTGISVYTGITTTAGRPLRGRPKAHSYHPHA